jgi:hypothetical protein
VLMRVYGRLPCSYRNITEHHGTWQYARFWICLSWFESMRGSHAVGWRTRVHDTRSQTRKDRHQRSIHARQPTVGWRTRVHDTRSHTGKDRHRRSIHARQPTAGWQTRVRDTRSHTGKDRSMRGGHTCRCDPSHLGRTIHRRKRWSGENGVHAHVFVRQQSRAFLPQ